MTLKQEDEIIKYLEAGNWKKNRTGSRNVMIFDTYHDSKYNIIKNKYTKFPTWWKICAKYFIKCGEDVNDKFIDEVTDCKQNRHFYE